MRMLGEVIGQAPSRQNPDRTPQQRCSIGEAPSTGWSLPLAYGRRDGRRMTGAVNFFLEHGVLAGLALILNIVIGVLLPSHGVAQARSDCDYASCALRIRGKSVLAGKAAIEVGRYGFFSSPEARSLMPCGGTTPRWSLLLRPGLGSIPPDLRLRRAERGPRSGVPR